MNLEDFLGNEILIRFRLNSDGFVTGDGFYFDDLKVIAIIDSLNTAIDQTNGLNIELYAYPNPAKDEIRIVHKNDLSSEKLQLNVTDQLGRTLFSKQFETEQSTIVNTSLWPNGIYYYYIEGSNMKSHVNKIAINK